MTRATHFVRCFYPAQRAGIVAPSKCNTVEELYIRVFSLAKAVFSQCMRIKMNFLSPDLNMFDSRYDIVVLLEAKLHETKRAICNYYTSQGKSLFP